MTDIWSFELRHFRWDDTPQIIENVANSQNIPLMKFKIKTGLFTRTWLYVIIGPLAKAMKIAVETNLNHISTATIYNSVIDQGCGCCFVGHKSKPIEQPVHPPKPS